MRIHEQARAESENLLPSPALWAEANERALRVLPDKTPEVRNGYVAGFLAGHEAATHTREAQQARDAVVRIAAERDAMRDAVLAIHHDDGDGYCDRCIDYADNGRRLLLPWPCPTALAVTPSAPPPDAPPGAPTPGM